MTMLSQIQRLGNQIFDNLQSIGESAPPLLQALSRLALQGKLRYKIPLNAGGYERIDGAPLHTWPEVFIQLSGRGRFTCAHDTLYADVGDMIIVPPGTPHAERLSADPQSDDLSPGRQIVLMCYEQTTGFILAQGGQRGNPIGLTFDSLPATGPSNLILSLVNQIGQQRQHFTSAECQQIENSFIAHILDSLGNALYDVGKQDDASSAQSLLRRCQRLVMNGLSDHHLSVAGIAGRLGLSADYCSNRYASESGETLSTYINRVRCRHAAQLLAHGKLKVSAIAWSCGYRDSGYFARVFAKLYGMRPRAYRNHYQTD